MTDLNRKKTSYPQCAHCEKHKFCKFPDGTAYRGCPTAGRRDLAEESLCAYREGEDREFYLQSLRQVASGYVAEGDKPHPVKNRLEEVIEFCHRMGYRRLGIAFCTALEDTAKKLSDILEGQGFEVVSAICKVGGIEKAETGLEDSGKIIPGRREITCNPLMQAALLNDAGTEFNIVVGLCVGHDSLFLKASDALCTVLIVKDRVLHHNPIRALED